MVNSWSFRDCFLQPLFFGSQYRENTRRSHPVVTDGPFRYKEKKKDVRA